MLVLLLFFFSFLLFFLVYERISHIISRDHLFSMEYKTVIKNIASHVMMID